MAAELPDLAAMKAKLRELRDEREKVAVELARTARALPTLQELEPLVRARLRDLRATLTADTGLGRLALGALLGEDRLRIYRDGRIEGTATLRPETLWAPRTASEPIAPVVAGAGFEPATCGL
jgi:transposase